MSLLAERFGRQCMACAHMAPRRLPNISTISSFQQVRVFSGTQQHLRVGGHSKTGKTQIREHSQDDGKSQFRKILKNDGPPSFKSFGGGSKGGSQGQFGGSRPAIRRGGPARGKEPWLNRPRKDVNMEEYTKQRLFKFRKDFKLFWQEELSGNFKYEEALDWLDLYEGKVMVQNFSQPESDAFPDAQDGDQVPDPLELKRAQSVGEEVFDSLLREGFRIFALGEGKMPIAELQKELTDLQYPHEWYPETRTMQRTWILHVGPTNSGKTYQALKRLEACESGVYAGPLRLLAHEIYEKFNAKGISCNLITGEEQRLEHAVAKVTSSTVEMVDMNRVVEVAVLDEIQMIGDKFRGWAWTQALLGVRAKEVHMCGEERTVDIIKNLAALTGDKLIINRYNRLGPLNTATESLGGDWKSITKGDCVVTFSRKDIFAIKKTIEETTGTRCAVVYGGLPPETRSQQAKLFNDQSNEYDVLVASDAVGMGLNLSIQRVIFETLTKYDGESVKPLEIPHIKQIGGRAGRYRVAPSIPAPGKAVPIPEVVPAVGVLPAAPNPGVVTTFEKADLKLLTAAMKADVPPIKTAGVHPPDRIIEKFAKTFPPRKPFSAVLEELVKRAKVNKDLFHLCSVDDLMHAAGVVEATKGLTVAERITIAQAPLPKRDATVKQNLIAYSKLIAESRSGGILDVEDMQLQVLDEYLAQKEMDAEAAAEHARKASKKQLEEIRGEVTAAKDGVIEILPRLESLHKSTMLWLWLSYVFPSTP
ncbi:P-loop containing nucleoside triphosphate hydrolase protein [Peziza echinospora]|nr:P-loop containing nucleoside triphosphate hydrolase protein [Peziza echinospora]